MCIIMFNISWNYFEIAQQSMTTSSTNNISQMLAKTLEIRIVKDYTCR